MTKLICIRAYSGFRPGDEVDLDVDAPERNGDGSYKTAPPWSELYLAEPDHVQAQRAIADRKAAEAAAAAQAKDGKPASTTPATTPAGTTPLTPTPTTKPAADAGGKEGD